MDKRYAPLFTPWKIGNVEIKNRIVVCPMGGTSLFGWLEREHLSKESSQFFLDIAKHGAGLVIPGIAPIRNQIGNKWLYKADKTFKDLKEYMKEFHKTGAKLFVQLTAGFGRSLAITPEMVMLAKHKVLGTL